MQMFLIQTQISVLGFMSRGMSIEREDCLRSELKCLRDSLVGTGYIPGCEPRINRSPAFL